MKNKKFLALVIGILIIFSVISYAETKKLKQIGRYTLVRIKGEVPTSEVMKILVDKYAGDIKFGFDLAGYGDLFLPFLDQIRASSFSEDELAVGDKMIWMLFRSRGKVKVVKDLEWAGEKPIPIFTFTVKKDFKHYEFFMPKACGNISLRKVVEIIPPAVCDIKVDPIKANINDPISIDMSGSEHAKSMEVEIVGPDGAKVATKALSPDAPRWQTKFAAGGEYTFKAKAINFEDKASTNPCEARVYINFPPECKLWTSCNPCKDYVGRPITFNASNSTDPDGEVTKADFEIKDETGNVVDTYNDSSKPFTWEKIFDKPGIYTITAVVTDDFGAMSQPCSVELEVTQRRVFFLADFGPLFARGSHGPYFAARVGMLYKIIPDSLDFILEGGGSLSLKSEPWKSFFLANALLNAHAGPAYLGGGLGFTTAVKEGRDSDVDLIGNIGFNIIENFSLSGSIFFEARAPVGSGRSFSKNHKLLLGFRMIF